MNLSFILHVNCFFGKLKCLKGYYLQAFSDTNFFAPCMHFG